MRLLSLITFISILGVSYAGSEEFLTNSGAVPAVKPLVLKDPVPVPETMGAMCLAAIGFMLIFRRRRY